MDNEFESPLSHRDSTIARDLNLNLQRMITGGNLEPKEAFLSLLALARTVAYEELAQLAKDKLTAHGLTDVEIREAEESAAMMGMLNTYYKFRTMITNGGKAEDYKAAGLRMTALAKPVLGKVNFEMLAFAVSVVNGCETCIISHEAVLRDAGFSADKIHDLARMAATVKALKVLSEIK
jgi:alkyl hydroperoxide reductase subunit D